MHRHERYAANELRAGIRPGAVRYELFCRLIRDRGFEGQDEVPSSERRWARKEAERYLLLAAEAV